MLSELSADSVLVAGAQQVSCDLAGEAAILHLGTGKYFGLNPTGAFLWRLLQSPQRLDALERAILDQYDVSPENCSRDLQLILGRFREAGLIELVAT